MALNIHLAAGAAALALALGGPALAQETTMPPAEAPATEAPETAAAFSEEKLEAFVTAALEVSGIQQQAAAQLQETADQAAQAEVVEQANAEMVAAIEDSPGITVPEYIEIAEAAEVDPALRGQIETMLAEAQAQ